ncbi:uncharacterized protein LOC128234400 [Mya arenaria]|uniref:uncharacterized protein LOC128234400 n=1 Tax=Mya arenaria TaxID=6604 RepID=UPI0022E801AD|nr:uncharacterized protein LOC128234400 [Mya arenaria]
MASKCKDPLETSVLNANNLKHDFSCSVCKEDDLNVEAKHFCGDCLEFYCDKCLTFHAKIHRRHAVLGRKDVDKWVEQGDALVSCDLHPSKVLELLCEDHAELCCHICVSLNHRLCRDINLISDVTKGIHKMANFKQLLVNVTKVTAKLNQTKDAIKKNQNLLNTSGKSMLTRIKDLRKTLNQLLDDQEKRTMEQMDRVLADLDGSLQKDIDHCDRLHDQLHVLLDSALSQDKDSKSGSYIGYRKCQDKMAEANELLQALSMKPEATITFQPDTRPQQLLSDLKALGIIQVYLDPQFEQSSRQIKQSSDILKVFKVKEKNTFAVNIKADKILCDIIGMIELSGGEIVLVDSKHCRAKVLDSNYKVTCHCDIPKFPQDICLISDHQVAVAVDGYPSAKHEVHFLTVSAGTITTTRKFKVNHLCSSIRHHGGQLYIGSLAALYLHTTTGKLLKKVYEDTSGKVTVNNFDLSTDGSKIYILASSHNKVVTIDTKGNILATLMDPDFDWPLSVHVSECGHVFVSSQASNTVVQVDQEGKKKLATLVRKGDGINIPQAVLYCTRTGRLIVGGQQNNILVMELQ